MPANFYEWIGFVYAIAGAVIVLGFVFMAVCSSLDPLGRVARNKKRRG